jgi:hypothetical protein
MIRSLCGSGLAKANPRLAPEVSYLPRKSLCLDGSPLLKEGPSWTRFSQVVVIAAIFGSQSPTFLMLATVIARSVADLAVRPPSCRRMPPQTHSASHAGLRWGSLPPRTGSAISVLAAAAPCSGGTANHHPRLLPSYPLECSVSTRPRLSAPLFTFGVPLGFPTLRRLMICRAFRRAP